MAYRLRWALAAMLGLVLGATVAYVVIEGYTWLDALYMTVITLGTIGYGEVEPLTQVGLRSACNFSDACGIGLKFLGARPTSHPC